MKFQVEDHTRDLIEKIVGRHLDGHEIEPCNIVVDVDDDGAQSIEIGLCYKLSSKPINPARSVEMLSAVRNALVESGDWRMPYVEHYFNDEQEIEGMRRAC